MWDDIDIETALRREEDLLLEASQTRCAPTIWFWQSQKAIVAPRKLANKPHFDDASAELRSKGWPVYTRATGGDVTPQGPGIVNVTLIFPTQGTPDIPTNYDRLCRPMERALGPLSSRGWNAGAFCDGAYNVQWDGLKFAGTAQRLKRMKGGDGHVVLAHALMMMERPAEDTIAALNLFLRLLDEPREIFLDRHTGLPTKLDPNRFLSRLKAAYEVELT